MISLAAGVFAALGSGPLAQSAFALGTVATTADKHIVYDRSTGRLYYDADGAGGAQTLFADIANKAALTFDDFVVA